MVKAMCSKASHWNFVKAQFWHSSAAMEWERRPPYIQLSALRRRVKERSFSSVDCIIEKTLGFSKGSPPKKFRAGIWLSLAISSERAKTFQDMWSPLPGEQPYKQCSQACVQRRETNNVRKSIFLFFSVFYTQHSIKT